MFQRKKLALGLALALGGGLVSGHQNSLAAQEFAPRPSADHPASAILLAGRATGLAQTDFDGDGVKDLAVAYRLGDRSAIAVFRGEYAALYPHFPAAVARRQALGGRVLPFDPEPLWVAETEAADFLIAGDFDADGRADLVWANAAAARLHFAGGSGQGNFGPEEQRALPAPPTALGAFELDRIDGLPEIAAGVDGAAGRQLLRFGGPAGAWSAEPLRYPVDEPITRLAAGVADEDAWIDLVLNDGPERLVLAGTNDEQRPAMRRLELSRRFLDREAQLASSAETFASLPMRLDDNALTDLVKIDTAGRLLFELRAPGVTYTVNSADDSFDGTCDAAHCSLRDAIVAANNNPGPDALAFTLPGPGPYRIQRSSPWPAITDTLTIDGGTQAGFAGEPLIELNGEPANGGGLYLSFSAAGSVIRSVVLNGFRTAPYIYARAVTIEAPGVVVENCRIGTSVDGLSVVQNYEGLFFGPGADHGQVGGTAANAGNLLAGNIGQGITNHSSDLIVEGNLIGVDKYGSAALPNGRGIATTGSRNLIGGTAPGARNLISGNSLSGIEEAGSLSSIQGNYIGTDLTGELALPNLGFGIVLSGSDSLVGGTVSLAASNLISGNDLGGLGGGPIGARIESNRFGIAASGNPLPNSGTAIQITGSRNRIGGILAAAGNAIAYNDSGIQCYSSAAAIRILGNSIVADNAFNLQCGYPPPVLTAAASSPSAAVIEGTLHGEGGLAYRIEFFSTPTCGQGGLAGGFQLLGHQDVTTDSSGNVTYLFAAPPLPVGSVVTATANPHPLIPGVGDTLNATGFSACRVVDPAPPTSNPNLQIPAHIPAGVGGPVTVPVIFSANTHAIGALTFSVDLASCLTFDPADSNADGIPDTVALNLPPGWAASVSYNAGDSDGELDFALFDLPPFVPLPSGTIAEISLGLSCTTNTTPLVVPVPFSLSPAPSFGNTQGQAVPGTFSNGSVDILPGQRGDCNGDGVVDAGDLTACGLEIFDGDGNFWLDAPGGSFPGNPVGCDSNADTVVDAGDLACTIRLIFGQSCAARAAEGFLPVSLAVGELEARAGSTLVPIYLETRGQSLTTTAFSLDLAADSGFDPSDHDGDGIPDAVRVLIPGNLVKVSYDAADEGGELDIILGDVSEQLRNLPRGNLLEIRFPVTGHARLLDFANDPPPSFGTATGASAPAVLSTLFSDGFESGNLAGWSLVVVP